MKIIKRIWNWIKTEANRPIPDYEIKLQLRCPHCGCDYEHRRDLPHGNCGPG